MKYKIKEVRKEKGLTQKQLGERLGVSASAISQFEADTANIKMETIEKIAAALGCYAHELLDFSGDSTEYGTPEEYEMIRQSLRKNREDIRHEQDEYFKEQLNELTPKLNGQGQLLLVKIAGALCSAPGLVREGETNILDDGDKAKEEI